MCQHVDLTMRDGSHFSYGLEDCSVVDGVEACIISEKSVAHLMASGQFKHVTVTDEEKIPKSERGQGYGEIRVNLGEKDFPAYIEKVLGSQALQERHHAPKAIGQLTR